MSYWKKNAYFYAKKFEAEHPKIICGETFTFGKYKGQKVKDVIQNNPSYVIWALNNVKGFRLLPYHYTLLTLNNNKNERF